MLGHCCPELEVLVEGQNLRKLGRQLLCASPETAAPLPPNWTVCNSTCARQTCREQACHDRLATARLPFHWQHFQGQQYCWRCTAEVKCYGSPRFETWPQQLVRHLGNARAALHSAKHVWSCWSITQSMDDNVKAKHAAHKHAKQHCIL